MDSSAPENHTQSPTLQAASDRRRSRFILVGALAVAGIALAFIAFSNVGGNLVYYWGPTELIEAGDDAVGASVRLAGLVVTNSVRKGADGLTLDFEITDGQNTFPIHAEAVPPAMFREGIGVVIEGTLGQDGRFQTDRLMVKHDNQYQAPDTEDHRSIDELVKTLQFDSAQRADT